MKINQYLGLFYLICSLFLSLFTTQTIAKETNFPVLLAKVYQPGLDISQYLVSEKLDGVRAIWDGKNLYSRQGNIIHAPAWFVTGFPDAGLDGELWIKRGQFDAVSGAVRKNNPIDEEWRVITYQVFELPKAQGDFKSRVQQLQQLVNKTKLKHLQVVPQFRLKDEAALQQKLKEIVALGGEGLMLHRADAVYITGRSALLLKLKPYFDAEAKVVAYVEGRGKYQGKMGALLVEMPDGIRFKLGTGFSDIERETPPKIGSLVTYSYKDISKTGKPKFASFLRVRTN